ncbi:MAG: DUF1189 family protein [Elusimicrobia bacterium]|nr:DUF1189 family protein [Elusimicrobiota bacterium]
MFLEPIQSVVDFSFYRKVPERSAARTVGYVFYLGFVFSGLATIALARQFGPLLRESIDWAANSIPPIVFADGKASSALAGPTIIRHPRIGDVALLIDTNRTTAVAAQELNEQKVSVYLTQNTLYLMTSPEKMEHYDLAKSNATRGFTIDANFYRKLGHTILRLFYPIAWLFAWMSFVVWKLSASLFYSLFALAIDVKTASGLPYKSLWRIAVYAQTPVVWLQTVVLFLPRHIPGFFLIAWGVAALYLWQALKQHQPAAQAAEPS